VAVKRKSTSSFSAFQNRFRKVIRDPLNRNNPLNLNDKQLKTIYNGISPVIETSIFAEMERVMTAIQTSLDAVSERVDKNINLVSYINNDINLNRIVMHITSNFQSLPEQRINILMVHNKAYQILEDNLFGEAFVGNNGFQKAYQLHEELLKLFHSRYHDLLFEGNVLDTDEKVESTVIEKSVQSYDVTIREVQEGGENG